jgi:hypothetical protein
MKIGAKIFCYCCLFLGIGMRGVAGQPLPEEWWVQNSPENILTNAQARTLQLFYFWGKKSPSLIDKNVSLEIFRRKTTDGKNEIKNVSTILVHGQPLQNIVYSLESGQYFSSGGQLTKVDFESIDDIIERVAGTFDHPYEYQKLKSETIGTNECIVVARIMTVPMANAVLDAKYNLTAGQNRVVSRDVVGKFTESIRDYYIRKNDGIILGYLTRNSSGSLVDDQLCDTVQINVPISKEEFLLPSGPVIVVHSWSEWTPIMHKSAKKSVNAILIKTAPEARLRRIIVIILMMVPSILLLIAILKKQFWHKSAKS